MVREAMLVATSFAWPFLAAGCGWSNPAAPGPPTAPAVAVISVGAETFKLLLPTESAVAAAWAAYRGGPAKIPNGRIVLGTEVNTGYSWHLEDVAFAEAAAEVCDGTPSMVERQPTAFGGGRFCPWAARVSAITAR